MLVKSEEEIEGDTTKGERKKEREREACNREKEMAGEKKRNSNRGTTRNDAVQGKEERLVERGRKTGLVVSTRMDINFPLTICH